MSAKISFAITLSLALLVGCDAHIEKFDDNELYGLVLAKSRATESTVAVEDAATVVDELFGSPNTPRWPNSLAEFGLVDADRLTQAAGAVSSLRDGTHRGLYREHCVVCHALPGSGAGPASLFQNPYPRDFRKGVYKWKSTERSAKPSREDLKRLLVRGVPGTAMPSFAILAEEDLESLIDYVIYLSVRGELERKLIAGAIDELDYGESISDDLRLSTDPESEAGPLVAKWLHEVAESWGNANEAVVVVPAFPTLKGQQLQSSVQRGKDIFHGQIANCVGCHGPSGNGLSLIHI